ncbi:MAG: hypothetical protein N3B11_02070 [Coriobacteriia bacterium]|nr:hypothetical protein [Coriobacteriia bacterium]
MAGAVLVPGLAVAAVLCGAVPWAVACLFVPVLESSPRAKAANYRGAEAVHGLGAAWLVWGGCALIARWALEDFGLPLLVSETIGACGALGVAASAFGLLDDTYGTREVRGFSGHVRALLAGRLTTGGLKLLGIGVASLAAARVVADLAPWGGSWVGVLLAGSSVALTANLVNLVDVRPGRALKVYLVLAAFAVALAAAALAGAYGTAAASAAAVLAVALIGPAAASWRYDLGERAMLGDAGANAMGAAAGLAIVAAMPLAGLVAFGVVMLALNLASERTSFSSVIDRTPLLARLDALGRTARPGEDAGRGERSTPSSRYDDHDGSGGDPREV